MTKREIMLDVIAKSKAHKRERQVQKEEIEDMREKVDADFDSVRHLLQGGKPAKRAAPADAAAAPAAAAAADADGPYEKRRFIERREAPGDADEYDSMVRELAQEKKAKPTNRLKTAEELAREERLKLEALEVRRRSPGPGRTKEPISRILLHRGLAGRSATGCGACTAKGWPSVWARPLAPAAATTWTRTCSCRRTRARRPSRSRTRTASSCSFRSWAHATCKRQTPTTTKARAWMMLMGTRRRTTKARRTRTRTRMTTGTRMRMRTTRRTTRRRTRTISTTWTRRHLRPAPRARAQKGPRPQPRKCPYFRTAYPRTHAPTHCPSPQSSCSGSGTVHRPRQGRLDAMRELPFVLPVPASASAFAALVDGRPPAELAEAISRIRKCNHPGLATGNRERLRLFFDILLDYLATLGATTPTVPLAHVDAMIPALLELATEVGRTLPTLQGRRIGDTLTARAGRRSRAQMPEWAAECCRTWLAGWEPALRHDLDERARLGKGAFILTCRKRAPALELTLRPLGPFVCGAQRARSVGRVRRSWCRLP